MTTMKVMPIANAREAHKAGKVWVDVKINGGNVPIREGDQPVGILQLKGPMTVEQSFALWMAANGHDPLLIAEKVHHYIRNGGKGPEPKASTLRELLERIRDVGPEGPQSLIDLRDSWLSAGTPGL